MGVFNPPISAVTIADATTLNGKTESELDVDTAVTAGDASTLGGKTEAQLVVLEAGNAITFGGYSVDHFMASDYSEFTSLTAEAINIKEHDSDSCDLSYTTTPEMLDVKTGSGLGRHWANLTIGEATIFGNQFTTDGEPRIRLGDPTGTYLTIETGTYGNSENEIVFRNENGDYKGIGVTKIDMKVGSGYKQLTADNDNLYYDEDIVWTAGNLTPSNYALSSHDHTGVYPPLDDGFNVYGNTMSWHGVTDYDRNIDISNGANDGTNPKYTYKQIKLLTETTTPEIQISDFTASEFATISPTSIELNGNTVWHEGNFTPIASNITLLTKTGSTYDDIQDWANAVQSSGRISGGVITAHSPADGTVDISVLKGFIKYADSEIGETRFFDLVASTSVALTDNQTNYIYVEYNAGTPRIQVTTDRSTIRHTDQFTLGRVFREGTGVEILMSGINLYNRTRKIHEKWIDTFGGLSYASGILTSATGLKPAISAGVMYAGSNRIDIEAKDCNTSGTFDSYYWNPTSSAWVITTGQTSLNVTQYNKTDTGTGLETLSNNRYAVHWLYVCPDGDIYTLFGQGDYTLANAQAVSAPALVPAYLSQWAKLAAKVIIARNATNVYSITYAWATQFPVQQVGAHNDLAGLQGGTTDQYYHLTSTQLTNIGTWVGALASDPSTPVDGTMYWNTGSNVLKVYVNASVGWKSFTPSA